MLCQCDLDGLKTISIRWNVQISSSLSNVVGRYSETIQDHSCNEIGYTFWFRLCQYMVGLVETSILGSSVIDIFYMTTPLRLSLFFCS